MRYLSVCSGIEAASVAWRQLGWQAVAFSEIEPFPSAVLAHHYPDVPNLGDMTTIARRVRDGEVEAPDVLCGGTPCQSFSIAGLRESLADERGNLTLKFVEIANAIDLVRAGRGEDECIVFWENVPGVLSTKDNAFGCFLGALAGEDCELKPPGKRWANAGCVFGPQRAIAWRVLDAQYFGLAQRRRRVFVVASARKGFDPATILFEWDGVRRDTAPSREARQTAPTIPARSTGGGGLGTDFDCDGGLIAHSLRGEGFDASEDGTGRGTPWVPHVVGALACNTGPNGHDAGNFACNQAVDAGHVLPVAYGIRTAVATRLVVRRLTPLEAESLQGFPRGYTAIPWRGKPADQCPDGPRYKSLGNSWAVPVVAWVGKRIQELENGRK